MNKIIEKLTSLGVDVGLKLLYAIIILFIGTKLIKLLDKLLKKSRIFAKIDKGLSTFILSFIKVTLYIVLFMTVASILGVPLTSMITLIGSAGLAVGLSLQGGLSNIAGGIIILLFKPFAVGDFIDTHSDSGTVKSISLFYTTLLTPDNKIISIPNGSIANEPTVNYSKENMRRLDVDFTVSYNNDIDLVKETLQSLVINDSRAIIDDKHELFIGPTNYNDSSITYTTRVWVQSSEYFNFKFYLLENVKKEFDKKKIEIPYPQLDVHLDK